jgi:hypothetical protein
VKTVDYSVFERWEMGVVIEEEDEDEDEGDGRWDSGSR